MGGSGKLDYALLGMGCFFALFWVGVVVAYNLGLHPLTMVTVGLVAGGAGASLTTQLERLDRGS